MKALVAFYSRSGITKKVAEAAAKELNADLEEIIDTKNRSGLLGWLSAGWDGTFRKPTVIEKIKNDPSAYDLVIVGTPIWGFFSGAPAARVYLSQNREKLKNVAFFCTKGGTPGKGTFKDMARLSNKEPLALLELTEDEVKKGALLQKTKEFADRLTRLKI